MTDDTSTTESTDDQAEEAAETRRSGAAADGERRLLEAIDQHAIALDTTDPTADPDDLHQLYDHLAGARFVGLGEATHGTREFFQLKHRLLRYLVTEHDVRVFGLEANFPEALALDDYVVHGEGDPVAALEGVYLWTWQVESVLALVEWLRAFNADRPVEDRVRFYGFDAQYTQGAVDELVEYLDAVDPDFLRTVREDLETAACGGIPAHMDDDPEARIEATERAVPVLRDRLHERYPAYVDAASERAWNLAIQHVRVLEQAVESRRASHDRLEGVVDEPDATERCLRVRDRAMADNVDWICEFEDADGMVIWAHDAHVNRVENASRDTDAAATSLGGHLADRHGDGYVALGFSFGRGSFQAVGEDPQADGEESGRGLWEYSLDGPIPGTVDATLARLDHPLAIVDVRAAREDDRAAEWLADPQQHFSVGATFEPDNPAEYLTEYAYADAFDAVCYVDETTSARPVDPDDRE